MSVLLVTIVPGLFVFPKEDYEMKFVDNGAPEDFARLSFDGLKVPLFKLSREELSYVVYGINSPLSEIGFYDNIMITESAYASTNDYRSIELLELSVRAEHCLKRAGIETIGQLCDMSELELSKLRNMGTKSIYEIKIKLETLGCKLKDSIVI